MVLTARRKDRIEALAAELPNAEAYALDVTDRAAVDAFAADLGRRASVDVLVNNAAWRPRRGAGRQR